MRFLRFILSRAVHGRTQFIGATLVGIVSGASSVVLLSIVTTILKAGLAPGWNRWAGAFVAVCAVVTLSRIMALYLLTSLGQEVIRDLRLELCQQVLTSPLALLEELKAHRLLATLTEDVNSVGQVLVIVPGVVMNGTIILGCLTYLAWLNLPLFLLLAGALVLGTITYQLPTQLGMGRFRLAREQDNRIFAQFRGLIEGIKELKLHRDRRRDFSAELAEAIDRQRRLRVSATLITGSAVVWGHLLFFVFIGILLFARPGSDAIETFSLVTYTVVVLYMMGPLQGLLDALPNIGRAEAAFHNVEKLGFSLARAAEASALPSIQAPPPRRSPSRLRLHGVTHSYRREGSDSRFRLGPIDVELRSGEVLFLVGGNGCGKTTLAKILVGLYTPDDGEILLDGRRVIEADRDEYRQLFSAVFSDFYLFERLLGLESPDLQGQARRYLKDLQIDNKVSVEGGRLSTLDLSLGQRKRLALLVAYLEDRPFYVFDEWAADQDPIFKEIFYREILTGLKQRGKGVIVISHDDRYFWVADRILKLEEGHLSYDGVYPSSLSSREGWLGNPGESVAGVALAGESG